LTSNSVIHTDVLVVGAGPAGLAAALAARSCAATVVVSGRMACRPPGLTHEILPGGTRAIIAALGLADASVGPCITPLQRLSSAWGPSLPQAAAWTMEHYAGWYVIDRNAFDRALLHRALNAQIGYRRATVRKISTTRGGGHLVEYDRGPAIDCRFIIDATGRHCSVARRLGAKVQIAHRLFTVASRVKDSQDLFETATAVIFTVPNGWSFTFPIAENVCLAQFFMSPIRNRSCAAIRTGQINGDCVRTASTAITDPLTGDGWLAVGDAAVALDPIASTGLTMALKSGLRGGLAAVSALSCDSNSVAEYAASLRAYFRAFLAERRRLYAMETKFSGEDFWQEQLMNDAHLGVSSI
jgi:flavin-dependent dehydrogenase